MQRIKYILLGIACALLLSYIVSYIYNKNYGTAGRGDVTKSGKSVCIYEGGEYALIDVEEYVSSVLAGMMDENWNPEMLKTMAVIIRTGIYYQMDMLREASGADNTGGDGNLVNESQLREIRYSEEDIRKKWGNRYTEIENDVQAAVYDTAGQVITYDGEPVMPAYHMVSTGHTVSAEEIYGYNIPYLQSVDSDVDMTADNFSETVIYSDDRLRKTFQKWLDNEDDRNQDEAETVKVLSATPSGFAKSINVFGCEVEGEVFKNQLGLQSSNIHIDKVDGGYRIITVGVGDSLGLSLYGAGILSQNGETYNEILMYYYTDVEISR